METEHNFIPCAKWIKRGVAKSKPEVVQLSKDELRGLVEKAKSDILGFAGSLKNIDKDNGSQNPDQDQFGMEDYDKDDEVEDLVGIGGLISLDDEDIDGAESQEDDEEDSDKDDDEIKPNDNLIAVGHVNGDISVLEVYVFNEEDNDLYVHHDIVLPTVPLALEWLSDIPGQTSSGNYLAMGGMTPEITIWNLDLVNSLEPAAKLGRFSKRKKDRHRNHGHRDAVLDLSWNTKMPHILASGSVDRTVLLWDLSTAKAATQFKDFEEKVQCMEWHPTEVNVLMAGSCDRKLRLFDCRIEEVLMTAQVDGEVERIAWHPTSQFHALVGTSSGTLCAVDCRSGSVIWQVKANDKEVTGIAVGTSSGTLCAVDCRSGSVIWQVKAHDKEVTGIAVSDIVCDKLPVQVGTSSGTLCAVDCRSGSVIWQVKAHDKEVTGLGVGVDSVTTCSTDETVKLWSVSDSGVELKCTKHTNMGELHCLSLCPENPDIVCVGGSKKSCNFKVISLTTDMQPAGMDVEADAQNVDARSDDGT